MHDIRDPGDAAISPFQGERISLAATVLAPAVNGVRDRLLQSQLPDWVHRFEVSSNGKLQLEIRYERQPVPGEVPALRNSLENIFERSVELKIRPKYDRRPSDQTSFKPKEPSLKSRMEATLPEEVELVRASRYHLPIGKKSFDLAIAKIIVPTGDDEVEQKLAKWRSDFADEHSIDVIFEREWESTGTMKRLQRRVGGRDHLGARDVKHVQAVINYFHGRVPRRGKGEVRPALPEKNIRDERELQYFTLDTPGTDSREDAICVEKNADGTYDLRVAFVDPTKAVKPGGAQDRMATRKGFTIYGRSTTLHLLGSKIALNIGSFIPHRDRNAIVARFKIGTEGEILERDFYRAKLKTGFHAEFGDLPGILEDRGHEFHTEMQNLVEAVAALRTTTGSRQNILQKLPNGAGDKESEALGSSIIDKLMTFSKHEFANFLHDNGVPLIYRVHTPPDQEFITRTIKELREAGVPAEAEDFSVPLRFASLLRVLEDTGKKHQLNKIIEGFLFSSFADTVRREHTGLKVDTYIELKHRDLAGWTNLCEAVAFFSGMGPVFSEEEREKRAAERNRKAMVQDELYFSLRFLEMLRHKLPQVGKTFSAEVLQASENGAFIQVDGFGRKGLLFGTNGRTLHQGERIQVRLQHLSLKKRAFVFTPVSEKKNG